MCFYGELDTYVIPGFNGTCTLGGVRSFDSESKEICPHEYAAIRERCNKLVPSLAKAKTIKHLTGIRPHRETVRVESEQFLNNGKTKVSQLIKMPINFSTIIILIYFYRIRFFLINFT